jgi:hypothetical protein
MSEWPESGLVSHLGCPLTQHKFRVLYVAVATALMLSAVVGQGPVAASTEPDDLLAHEVAAVADRVAGPPIGQADAADGVDVDLAQDADDEIVLEGTDGTTLSVDVPGSPTAAGGQVVYDGAAEDTSIVARQVPGGAQALIVLNGPDAPSRFDFPIEVGDDPAVLRLTEGGGVEVLPSASGPAVAAVAAPWATDASGRQVPTHFEVRSGHLTQVVDHVDADYPVVADPQVTWGWVTGTVYFTRAETRKAKTVSGLLSVVAVACAGSLASGPAAPFICAGMAGHAAVIAIMADYYYGEGKCLKIKLPHFEPGSVRRGDRNCR